MTQRMLDTAVRKGIVEDLADMLRNFHDAKERNEGGSESLSRRGHLGGYRRALGRLYGERIASGLLEAARKETGLQFPHMGPVHDDGTIYNVDMEAGYGL